MVEKIGKKYRAKTYVYGKQLHLGMYSTKKEAEQAVKDSRIELLPTKWGQKLVEVDNVSLWMRIKVWGSKWRRK